MFVLASLLGFRFAPRIADALAKKLYVLAEVRVSEQLHTLVFDQINTKLMIEQWDEMRRVASSIRHGSNCGSHCPAGMGTHPHDQRLAFCLATWSFFGKSAATAPARGE